MAGASEMCESRSLKGEGRTAEGSPGWGDGRAIDDPLLTLPRMRGRVGRGLAEPLSPPPVPLARADLPPPGGGGEAWTPSLTSGSGRGQRRGVRSRRNGPERGAGAKPARRQSGRRRRGPAVNVGKIREGHSGSLRRSPSRANADPARPRLQGGTAVPRAPLAEN